jgi:hypothetical protein
MNAQKFQEFKRLQRCKGDNNLKGTEFESHLT